MQPPIVVRYSVSSVPILQLALSSTTLSDAQLYDYARLQLRAAIQTIPGIRMTLPYGGQVRQIMVDIDPQKLQAYGLTPSDVSRAVTAQNLTLPSGTIKEGVREPFVTLNLSPETAAAFHDLPLRAVDGRVIFLRDVANVRDGGAVQTNVARMDGQSGVFVSLIKLGDASTVAHRRPGAGAPARDPRRRAGRLAHRADLRPVRVRAHRHRCGPARGRAGRRAGGGGGAAVPGQRAQHLHRAHLDPAVAAVLGGCAVHAGLHAQPDDAGRARARDRHPGRQRHGGDREHQPQVALGKPLQRGDPGQRPAGGVPGVRVHAVASASCSCRCSCSAARRPSCSRRWRWPWCSR